MLAALLAVTVTQAAPDSLPGERAMMMEARAIIATQGERVWPGYSKAPFEVDVVEPSREVLFCRKPQPTFHKNGSDPVTRCSVQTRPRELPVDLSASGDQLPGGSVIIMGTQKSLDLSRADYIITLIHEAFHQFQSVHAAYEEAVQRARPTSAPSGWMLSYAFPYGDERVGAAFVGMTGAARAFLKAETATERRSAISAYVRARRQAQAAVSARDWAYYEFQVGQEGVARWTEIVVGEAANDPEVAAAARDHRAGLKTSLTAIDRQGLGVWKRSVFYVMGPIEIDMLTSLGVNWGAAYFARPFAFGERLDAACREQLQGCGSGPAEKMVPAVSDE